MWLKSILIKVTLVIWLTVAVGCDPTDYSDYADDLNSDSFGDSNNDTNGDREDNNSGEQAPSSNNNQRKLAIVLTDFFPTLNEAEFSADGTTLVKEGQAYLNREIAYMSEVLMAANSNGIPVFEVNFDGSETHSSLARYRNSNNWTIIPKDDPSAFVDTGLHENYLNPMGIENIIVMGFNQVACIRATIESAIGQYYYGEAHDYTVFTSFDIIQGHITENSFNEWNNNNRFLENEYGFQAAVGSDIYRFDALIDYYKRFDKVKLIRNYDDLPIFHLNEFRNGTLRY